MRNLALMWALAGVALLSASLYVHSETIDSADADYCIDWNSEKTEFDGKRVPIRLVLVKKNNDLRFTQDSIECIGKYGYGQHFNFYFTNELGQQFFSFGSIVSSTGGYKTDIDGPCMMGLYCDEPEYLKQLPSKIKVTFPQSASYKTTTLKKFKKDDLLRFKNKIIDANILQRFFCERGLDTTIYRMDFRAKITGECGCDSIKEEQK